MCAVNDVNNVRLFMGMGVLNILQTPILYTGRRDAQRGLASDALGAGSVSALPADLARVRQAHLASLATQEQLGTLSSGVQERHRRLRGALGGDGRPPTRSILVENQQLYRRELRLAVSTGMFTTIDVLPASRRSHWSRGRTVRQVADLWLFYGYSVLLVSTFLMGFVVDIAMRALAGLELGEILDTVPSIRDRDDVLGDLPELRGAVDVQGLSSASGSSALSDVSLQLSHDRRMCMVRSARARARAAVGDPRLL